MDNTLEKKSGASDGTFFPITCDSSANPVVITISSVIKNAI
jgi:hypothetical protein